MKKTKDYFVNTFGCFMIIFHNLYLFSVTYICYIYLLYLYQWIEVTSRTLYFFMINMS